jgi:hypothetical protein
MRIAVEGTEFLTDGLKRYLESAGYRVSGYAPFYTITLVQGAGPNIVVDSVDSPFEREIINRIAELTPVRIELARAGGVQSTDAMRIEVPFGTTAELLDAIERGVLRAVLIRTGNKQLPDQPGLGPKVLPADLVEALADAVEEVMVRAKRKGQRPWWKVWTILLVVCLLAGSGAVRAADEPTKPPAPVSTEKKVEILIEQLRAYRRLTEKLATQVRFLTAQRDALEKVATQIAERELAQANDRLDHLDLEVRKLSNADPAWGLTDNLEWAVRLPVSTRASQAPVAAAPPGEAKK